MYEIITVAEIIMWAWSFIWLASFIMWVVSLCVNGQTCTEDFNVFANRKSIGWFMSVLTSCLQKNIEILCIGMKLRIQRISMSLQTGDMQIVQSDRGSHPYSVEYSFIDLIGWITRLFWLPVCKDIEILCTAFCRVRTGFPKSDHVIHSNSIAHMHVIAFGKTSCKNSAKRVVIKVGMRNGALAAFMHLPLSHPTIPPWGS